ncbi:hypothetical protein MPSEU_000763600 [Mayamaea pseudoterrestris]|nr:hypothetical protein MPSEU_000763600 [Mayamaea pseudoterrestris]
MSLPVTPTLPPNMISTLPAASLPLARSLMKLSVQDVALQTPLQLFCLQLESNSLEASVDAMHRLVIVAQSLMWNTETTTASDDPDNNQVVNQLIPYLTQFVTPPHSDQPDKPMPADELLLLLGQELSRILTFPKLVPRQYYPKLLDLMEKLASVEETVVRDQAVVVFVQLCDGLVSDVELQHQMKHATADDDDSVSAWQSTIVSPFVATWKRLVNAEWFTSKVSACGMASALLRLVNSAAHDDDNDKAPSTNTTTTKTDAIMEELLHVFKDLCMDDAPMVRRGAAKDLGKVICAAGIRYVELIRPALPALVQDEQDSVRKLAVSCLAHVGDEFGAKQPEWTVQHWLPLVKDGSTDMSWRVRNDLAKTFSVVATNLGIQHDARYVNEQSLVMACFATLLTDAEADVRAAAVAHLARMLFWGGPAQFQTHLQPLLPALADDPVMEVRSKCALGLMEAAESGTLEDAVVLQAFEPLLDAFLQDEFHEVQLQVLTNLHKVSHLLPGLTNVVSSLLRMTKASNWRVRESIARLLPHLAEARGTEWFQSMLLESVWMPLLLDPVASVRAAVVHGMQLLVKVSGDEWVLSSMLPQHISLYQQTNSYLIRNTIIMAHVEVACQCKSGELWQEAVLQITRALNDKVPNVRMVSAKGLGKVVMADGDADMIQAQVRPALEKRMAEEEDTDCRAACAWALEKIE